jgi:hypothetical protein
MLLKRKKIDLPTMADIENAVAGTEQNAVSIDDIMTALVEVGEIVAEQDDTIAKLTEDQKEVGKWQKSTITASKLA